MPYFRKSSPFRSRSPSQHGQALVEYVLMLIITVSLVLAMMNQIFKPFGTFIENYMGKYVGCLLEYGELPSLGSQDESEVNDDSECDKQFEVASASAGRPPRESPEGGGSNTNPAERSNGNNSSGAGGGSSGSSRRVAGSRISRSGISTGAESGAARPAGKTVEIALGTGSGGAFFGSSSSDSVTVRSSDNRRITAITGLTEEEKKKLERQADGRDGVIVTGEGVAQKPKKMAVKKPEPQAEFRVDEPFTIGNFMRFIFIAAIIIALVVFVGGQVLQMSKSDNS